MILYFIITTILTLISLIFLIVTYENKKINYYFVVLLTIMCLSNVGYLSLAASETLETAILSTKLTYLGGCFIPVVGLFLSIDICNIKCPTWIRNALYIYSVLVFIMVTMIGYNDFYYKSQYIEMINGITVMRHTYGIGHYFFYAIMYGYLTIEIGILIYAFVKKINISRKIITAIMLTGIVNILSFFLGKLFVPDLEVMPFVYVMDSIIFMYIYRKGAIYNIDDNVSASITKQDIYGYIMFDKKFKYLGCNDIASQIIPKLGECAIDKKINNITELDFIINSLNNYAINKEKKSEFLINDKYYSCNISDIVFKHNFIGYMLELKDETNTYNSLQLLSIQNAELEGFQAILKAKVDEQTKLLTLQQARVKELYLKTVLALSEVVDAKDRYTSGHSLRVAKYAKMIAERMGKSKSEQDKIYHAGLLHDVGKIRIPEGIINKPGKLTDEEFNMIKLHPITGFNILKEIDNNHIAIAAKYHHERFDGNGYPTGLAGENIPEIARILCVADSYDAMTSDRSYRKALPQDVVRAEIEKCSGSQFDPKIAKIMLEIIDSDIDYEYKQLYSNNKKILLVDENEQNNIDFKKIMSDDSSYDIISVNDVDSAINEINNARYDALVVDIDLPDIRKLEMVYKKNPTPVILTTNNKYDPSLDFKHGCSDYITKPYFSMLVKEVLYYVTKHNDLDNND